MLQQKPESNNPQENRDKETKTVVVTTISPAATSLYVDGIINTKYPTNTLRSDSYYGVESNWSYGLCTWNGSIKKRHRVLVAILGLAIRLKDTSYPFNCLNYTFSYTATIINIRKVAASIETLWFDNVALFLHSTTLESNSFQIIAVLTHA